MGGLCLLVELHLEGSAPAAYPAGLFIRSEGSLDVGRLSWSIHVPELPKGLIFSSSAKSGKSM